MGGSQKEARKSINQGYAQAMSQIPQSFTNTNPFGTAGYNPQGSFANANPQLQQGFNQALGGFNNLDQKIADKSQDVADLYYQPFQNQTRQIMGDYYSGLDGGQFNSKGQLAMSHMANNTANRQGRQMYEISRDVQNDEINKLQSQYNANYQPITQLLGLSENMTGHRMNNAQLLSNLLTGKADNLANLAMKPSGGGMLAGQGMGVLASLLAGNPLPAMSGIFRGTGG